jgi:hypothetical protein
MTPLLKFRVTQHVTDTSTVPSTLRSLPDIGQPTVTRNFSFNFASNHWSINGQQFDPNRIDARPVLGTTEKWVFTNPTDIPHLVHIHDVDQQCISRDGGPCYPYEPMKETWNIGPGETLELKLRFTDHVGIYMLHCHILEHEDDGMMTLFEVVPPLVPTQVVSRKTHGAAGTFDIDLPLAGRVGVECRSGGGTNSHQIVATFPSPVTFVSANVTSGTGTVASTSGNGTTSVTVNLTGVTSGQNLAVTISANGTGNGDLVIPMGVLVGDTNWSRTVSASDVAQTKSQIGQPISATNFRGDINANGALSATDVAIVKASVGASLPPSAQP